MSKEFEETYEIQNTLGLHARPASLFVQVASSFDSEILVEKDGEAVNAKSLMGLLMLSATFGTHIKIIAKGDDSQEAVEALGDLINRKFDED